MTSERRCDRVDKNHVSFIAVQHIDLIESLSVLLSMQSFGGACPACIHTCIVFQNVEVRRWLADYHSKYNKNSWCDKIYIFHEPTFFSRLLSIIEYSSNRLPYIAATLQWIPVYGEKYIIHRSWVHHRPQKQHTGRTNKNKYQLDSMSTTIPSGLIIENNVNSRTWPCAIGTGTRR